MIKRLFDLTLSTVLLVGFSPVILLVAVALKVSGMPPLFTQERPGLRGEVFRIYKFQTMRAGAGSDTERLTRLGRLLRKASLDELPQLFNIFRGDMSFVGPRPLLMRYVPHYSTEQFRRHDAKPGITGWAQVNGRNALEWDERFKLDVYYVDHQSFWFDMRILALTAMKVVKREGLVVDPGAIMKNFDEQ